MATPRSKETKKNGKSLTLADDHTSSSFLSDAPASFSGENVYNIFVPLQDFVTNDDISPSPDLSHISHDYVVDAKRITAAHQ